MLAGQAAKPGRMQQQHQTEGTEKKGGPAKQFRSFFQHNMPLLSHFKPGIDRSG